MIINPEIVIFAAGALNTTAYLIINQVLLRLVILVSSTLYIVYYAIVADTPLWTALTFSALTVLANLIGLTALALRDSERRISADHSALRAVLREIPAGEFVRLMRLSRARHIDVPTMLTLEAAHSDRLHYLASGQAEVEKLGQRFMISAPCFIGEVAYMTGTPASGTVVAQAGDHVLSWDVARLKAVGAKRVRFVLALNSLISSDLAGKVAASVAVPRS